MACRLMISLCTILQILHKSSCNFACHNRKVSRIIRMMMKWLLRGAILWKSEIRQIQFFIGCFEDYSDGRILPSHLKWSVSMTTSMCINHCKSKSLKYAGTQYGRQCFCGDGANLKCAGLKPIEECNLKCKGNNSEFCGGHYRMHIYTEDVPVVSISICSPSTTEEQLSTNVGSLITIGQHVSIKTFVPPVSITEELTSSWPMTSTAKQQVSPRMFCECKCNVLNDRSTLTNTELKKRILDVKKKLKLNKSSTSRFIRSKVSAGDDRQTAAGVGVLGIVMLSIVLVTIVLSDIIKLIAYIKSC